MKKESNTGRNQLWLYGSGQRFPTVGSRDTHSPSVRVHGESHGEEWVQSEFWDVLQPLDLQSLHRFGLSLRYSCEIPGCL